MSALKLTPRKTSDDGKPAVIILVDDCGWTENGVLRQFRANQIVRDSRDIESLIAHSAEYEVLK